MKGFDFMTKDESIIDLKLFIISHDMTKARCLRARNNYKTVTEAYTQYCKKVNANQKSKK